MKYKYSIGLIAFIILVAMSLLLYAAIVNGFVLILSAICAVITWVIILIELRNAPLMDDDYDEVLTDKNIKQ